MKRVRKLGGEALGLGHMSFAASWPYMGVIGPDPDMLRLYRGLIVFNSEQQQRKPR
jgi:hypothetical protein